MSKWTRYKTSYFLEFSVYRSSPNFASNIKWIGGGGEDRNSLHLVLKAKFGDHSLLSFRKNKFLVWICFYFGLFGVCIFVNHLLRMFFNPFPTSVSILYPLKTPENQILFDAFGRYKMGTLARNWLNDIWSARAELAVNISERET